MNDNNIQETLQCVELTACILWQVSSCQVRLNNSLMPIYGRCIRRALANWPKTRSKRVLLMLVRRWKHGLPKEMHLQVARTPPGQMIERTANLLAILGAIVQQRTAKTN